MCTNCDQVFCRDCLLKKEKGPEQKRAEENLKEFVPKKIDMYRKQFKYEKGGESILLCQICDSEKNSKILSGKSKYEFERIVKLNKYRLAIYNRLVVTCPHCTGKFMIKNKKQHFEKYCKQYKYYYCKATVCNIKTVKHCSCEYCKFHDCYDLKAATNEGGDNLLSEEVNKGAKLQLTEAEKAAEIAE